MLTDEAIKILEEHELFPVDPDDEVVLLGTGNKKSGFINSVCGSKVVFEDIDSILNDDEGYYHLGFTDKLSFLNLRR